MYRCCWWWVSSNGVRLGSRRGRWCRYFFLYWYQERQSVRRSSPSISQELWLFELENLQEYTPTRWTSKGGLTPQNPQSKVMERRAHCSIHTNQTNRRNCCWQSSEFDGVACLSNTDNDNRSLVQDQGANGHSSGVPTLRMDYAAKSPHTNLAETERRDWQEAQTAYRCDVGPSVWMQQWSTTP